MKTWKHLTFEQRKVITNGISRRYKLREIAIHATSTSKIGLMYASDWGYAIEDFKGVLGYDGSHLIKTGYFQMVMNG